MSGNWQLSIAEDPAGPGLGEDRWLFHESEDGTAWAAVIDGASTSFDERPSGGDYADALRRAVLHIAPRGDRMSLIQVLTHAIRQVVQDLQLPTPSAPSAAIGLLRWSERGIDAVALGDVTVALLHAGEEHILRDTRLSHVAQSRRNAYKAALRSGDGFGPEHDERMSRLRFLEREVRNTANGYWIAAELPTAASYAIHHSTDSQPDSIVLATDGAAAALGRYRIWDSWREAGIALEHDTRAFVAAIRQAEASDPHGRRWPRSKRQDDLVAMRLMRD